jgi:hypothetical protein
VSNLFKWFVCLMALLLPLCVKAQTAAIQGFCVPYSIALELSQANGSNLMGATDSGLYLFDGTKLEGIECLSTGTNGVPELRVEHITNVTTDGSTVFGGNTFPSFNNTENCLAGAFYVRWRNNGTTLFADASPDGVVWNNFYSEAVGSFITPTSYGWGGVAESSPNIQIKLGGWLATNSAAQ